MTRVEEIERQIYSLAVRFHSFSAQYGDWARAIVSRWDGTSFTGSVSPSWLANFSSLSRLELVQLIVSGEPERLGMVEHTQEWVWLKNWAKEWESLLMRERERERERRRWP